MSSRSLLIDFVFGKWFLRATAVHLVPQERKVKRDCSGMSFRNGSRSGIISLKSARVKAYFIFLSVVSDKNLRNPFMIYALLSQDFKMAM